MKSTLKLPLFLTLQCLSTTVHFGYQVLLCEFVAVAVNGSFFTRQVCHGDKSDTRPSKARRICTRRHCDKNGAIVLHAINVNIANVAQSIRMASNLHIGHLETKNNKRMPQ